MPTASELITKIEVQGVDQYARDMGKVEAVTDKTAKNMDQAGKQASGLGSSFGSAAKQAGVLAAGLGAFDIGKSAISGLFGAMEDGMKTTGQLQAQLGLTKQEAEALGDTATQVFRNNFAGSMAEASAAVGQVQQMLGTMDSSALQTATENAFRLQDAFGTETSESLSAVKTLMDNFGLSSQEAFDLVTQGFQKGLNRSGDFLETINEYSTQFKNGGASADQFFSLLQSGLQGGVLGTDKAADAFKEFRLRIQDGSDTTKEALENLFSEASGDLKKMYATHQITQEEYFRQVGTQSEDFLNKLADGEMTAAEAFTVITDKLRGVTDESLKMQIGTALLGTQFEDLGTSAVDGLSLVGASTEAAAGKTAALDAQYTGIGSKLEGLKRQAMTSFLQPLAEHAGSAVNAILPLVGAIGSLGLAIPALLPVIGPVVAILAGPLTLAIVGIGAAIAVLALAWQNDWGGIQGKTQAVVNAIQPILEALGGRLREFGEVILPELTAAWQNMADQIGSIASGLQGVVEPIFNAIAGFLRAHDTEIRTILQGAWDAIVVIITTVTGIISNNIQFWLNILQGDWDGAWQNVKNIVSIAWEGIKSLVDIAIKAIPAIINLGMAAVQTVVEAAWNAIKSAVDSAINGEGGVVAIMRAMPGAILAALEGIGNLLRGVGADLIQGFINGVNDMWNDAVSFVGDLFGAVISGVKGVLGISSPSTVMRGMGVDFIQGFIDGTGSMAGALKDFVTGLVGSAVSAARDAAGGIAGAVGGAAGAVGGLLGGGGGGASGDAESWIRAAMAATGVDESWYAGLVRLMQLESGGNPSAVNPQAVIQNGVNYGHATGLFQTLPGTFAANNLSGGSITDPVANAIAAINYIKNRYGHVNNAVQGHAQRGGYAAGGTVAPGWFTVGERGFELGYLGAGDLHIFSNAQSKALLSGMSGGSSVPGFAGGTGAGFDTSRRFGKPDQFAAAVASPGGWTPDLAAAWFEGLKFIAEGMEAINEEFAAVFRQNQAGNLSAEMKRFAEWVKQYGGGVRHILESEGVEAAWRAYYGQNLGPSPGGAGAPGPVQVNFVVDGRTIATAVAPAISEYMVANVRGMAGGA